jgi:hypothetical protein
MVYSKLQLVKLLRPGEILPDGSYKTRREFLDFVVDGTSLFGELVKSRGTDLIGALWLDKTYAEVSIRAAERLMLLRPPDSPSGRRSIYVCPECGDLDCGAVTAQVGRSASTYTWSGFVLENNYDDYLLAEYREVGPFSFEATDYESTLGHAIETHRALP